MPLSYSQRRRKPSESVYEDYGYILRGRQRRTVVAAMERPMLPSQIARTIKGEYTLSLNNVSRVLRDLERHGLVKCVTPDKATGRVYLLTDRGRRARKELLAAEE